MINGYTVAFRIITFGKFRGYKPGMGTREISKYDFSQKRF